MESEYNNQAEGVKPQPVPETSREIVKEINGKTYRFGGVKYKKLKVLKKTAGDDMQLFNDKLILECIKEPRIKMVDLDDMDLPEIVEIQKCVAQLTGVSPDQVKGF